MLFKVATTKTGFQNIRRKDQYPDAPSFKTGMKLRSVIMDVLCVTVRSVATPTVPASRSMLVVTLTTRRGGGVLAGLLLYDVRAGNHWEGLWHPRLSLDIGLLRVRPAALIENRLVRIVGAPGDWHRLYAPGILLWVGGCGLVRG